MSGVALALAGACLLVTPVYRPGSTALPDRPFRIHQQATQVAPSYFPDRFDWQPRSGGARHGCWRLDDAVKHAIAK